MRSLGMMAICVIFTVRLSCAEDAKPVLIAHASTVEAGTTPNQTASQEPSPVPPPLKLGSATKAGIIFGSVRRFFQIPEKKPQSANEPIQVSASEIGHPEVRLVGVQTDACKRYMEIVPDVPIPPFSTWRHWLRDHSLAVHCALEWRNESGAWFHGELRSVRYDLDDEGLRVGTGEFVATGYSAYAIYIVPGKTARDRDEFGRKMVITVDEVINCDYRDVEREMRRYGAKYAKPGDPGTGGSGTHNVGLGGPAYKPTQNSNTMVKYILRKCGVEHKAPDLAIGWDTEANFPHSTNADMPALDAD